MQTTQTYATGVYPVHADGYSPGPPIRVALSDGTERAYITDPQCGGVLRTEAIHNTTTGTQTIDPDAPEDGLPSEEDLRLIASHTYGREWLRDYGCDYDFAGVGWDARRAWYTAGGGHRFGGLDPEQPLAREELEEAALVDPDLATALADWDAGTKPIPVDGV